ncbi:MAG: PIG-L family deacetylase [Intrasporangium sp.]|uniref:PIG-L family deacetylase n=1 Tax=Intrasporangium sp. TaxID=1925024 RepID=UPI00264715F7|nr:PIG-L deacetylase family protein [Intrasporangium sp.]MDN5798035.1 PIG-L family deacetylase [Intrasporangium sp.]
MTSTAVSAPRPTVPHWRSVLAVVAHPDDESFGLGAVLDALARSGSSVSVLCFTHGEASTVRGVSGDLATVRAAELQAAAAVLGVASAQLRDHPDGSLDAVQRQTLVEDVSQVATAAGACGLVVFDPNGITGHPDHVAATTAALEAADTLGLPVLGWTLPHAVADQLNEEYNAGFIGREAEPGDLLLPVDRVRQRAASAEHSSQAVPTSVLWRRLELLGDLEHLRWLRGAPDAAPCTPPGPASYQVGRTAQPEPAAEGATRRIEHRGDDQFAIAIRDDVLTIDRPEQTGGQNVGSTPAERFVAPLPHRLSGHPDHPRLRTRPR